MYNLFTGHVTSYSNRLFHALGSMFLQILPKRWHAKRLLFPIVKELFPYNK